MKLPEKEEFGLKIEVSNLGKGRNNSNEDNNNLDIPKIKNDNSNIMYFSDKNIDG